MLRFTIRLSSWVTSEPFWGFLYAYAFTAAPAAAILLILAKEQNLLIAGLIEGFGALLGDLVIFHFVRHSFSDEIQKLSQEKIVKTVQKMVPSPIQKHLLAALASILIASPLPTEIGITLLASIKNVTTRKFSIIAYILHSTAIFTINSTNWQHNLTNFSVKMFH